MTVDGGIVCGALAKIKCRKIRIILNNYCLCKKEEGQLDMLSKEQW